jgi:hypothetical protein
LAKPEVYALLDDNAKKEVGNDLPFEFTNETSLDTTQEEVKSSDKSGKDLFKKDEEEFDWDDI